MRTLLQILFLATLPTRALAADPAPVDAPKPAAPKPIVGPSASLAVPLVPGKPVGAAIGLQAIVPHGSWRIGAEVFLSTPVTAFAPALGGDVGVGLVGKPGVGGALAVYARHTFETKDVTASTQVGPGVVLLNKIAPTVVMMLPFVVWIDPVTKAVTPTLSVKVVFGAPYGKTPKG